MAPTVLDPVCETIGERSLTDGGIILGCQDAEDNSLVRSASAYPDERFPLLIGKMR